MSALEFGRIAPCRRCKGTGNVRHEKDDQAARERARARRHGAVAAPPDSMDPCPVCEGKGFLPVELADRPARR